MPIHRSRPYPDLRRTYLALVIMGSIGAHLVSEFAGMGIAAGRITLSPLHYYLGAALLIALLVLTNDLSALLSNASSRRDAKRLAEIGLMSLPFAGKRGFITTTACLQFALGWTTVVAEGSPLLGHDVGAGAIGAIISAFILSLVIRAITRRLPSIAQAVVEYYPVTAQDPQCGAFVEQQPACDARATDVWCSRLFNRPPPSLQSA
ncbi:MAG TPA: hypothetical protein VEV38_03150 [Candidatus Eremiobacteraceae bacterium]|nr:hypothetical protein [Candidatus Eremiobacteraceae bacterium]